MKIVCIGAGYVGVGYFNANVVCILHCAELSIPYVHQPHQTCIYVSAYACANPLLAQHSYTPSSCKGSA